MLPQIADISDGRDRAHAIETNRRLARHDQIRTVRLLIDLDFVVIRVDGKWLNIARE